jgi:prephenate dehydrogenase
VALLSPEEHDRALAATSHLPHLVAAALAGATPEEWLRLTGTGWADATRIAAGDPELWTQIFEQNRAGVIDALRRFEHRLQALEKAIADSDNAALFAELQEARRIRDALGD